MGDLSQDGEIWGSGGGRPSTPPRAPADGILSPGPRWPVVEESGSGIDPVASLVKELPGNIGSDPMGEVPTGIESHAHHALGVQFVAQLIPANGVKVVHVTRPCLVEERLLDSVGKDGTVSNQVGVDSRMRLDIGVIGTEQCFGVVG